MHKNKYSILETFSSPDSDDINKNINNQNENSNDSDTSDINSINDENNTEHNLNFRAIKLNKYYNKKKNINKKNNYDLKLNHKKIMCQNIINNNCCIYQDKCLYAHSLQEQKIDIKRKKIYELLDSTDDLSNIEPYKYKELYKELQIFTKLCNDCMNNKCTGGFNCKFGAPLIKYLVCYDDLNYGNCTDNECTKIHLTKRALKPQYNNISTKINTPNINNLQMLSPFMNNINNLWNNMSNINYYEEDNSISDNNISSDEDCLKSIFIEKFIFDD